MAAQQKLNPIQQRQVAAVVGALVAEAAAQPLHWIYNQDDLKALTDGVEEIEFRTPSANPFFRLPKGENSAYGDSAMASLRSLINVNGHHLENLSGELFTTFGPASEYGPLDMDTNRQAPIDRPWRNGAIHDFVQNVLDKKAVTGSPTDNQIDCVVQIIPLVVLYAGRSDMLDKVTEAVKVTQASDVAVAYSLLAARVLEQFILHANPKDVLQKVLKEITGPQNKHRHELDKSVAEELQKVIDNLSKSHSEMVPSIFTNSCAMPGSILAAIHCTLTSTGYVEGVRNTMRVGGSSASRASFIGACLAAKGGLESVPQAWKFAKVQYNEILTQATALANIKLQS